MIAAIKDQLIMVEIIRLVASNLVLCFTFKCVLYNLAQVFEESVCSIHTLS